MLSRAPLSRRVGQLSRRNWGLLGAGLITITSMACGEAMLVPGATVEAELSADGHGRFEVALRRGTAVRVLVEQFQTDLVLAITPPGGAVYNLDMRERGVESATLIAESDDTFQIAIAPKGPLSARIQYNISVDGEPHPVTPADQKSAAAERLESDGKRLATGDRPVPAEALFALRSALSLWRELNDTRGIATTLARTGDMLRVTNKPKEAEAAYASALELFRSSGQTYQVALLENNLGATLYNRGVLDEAGKHYQKALELWSSFPGAEIDRAATLSNEAAMLVESGDYYAALERLLLAAPTLEHHPRLGPPLLNLLGVAYRAVGDLDAAEQYFVRARAALPPDDPRITRLGLRLAQIALGRGHVDVAAAGVHDALAAIRGVSTPDRLFEAEALDLLGQVEIASGRFDAALANHEQALAIYRRAEVRRGVATALHYMGVANRHLGRLDAARAVLTKALAMRREIGLTDPEAETNYELGVLERDAGALPVARQHLDAAITLIEDVRGRVSGEYSRTLYFANRQKYFAAMIDVLMRLHAVRPANGYAIAAFEIAERERARSLIDLLRESGADARRGVNPELREQQREQQRRLDFWASRLARLSNQPGATVDAKAALEQMNVHLTAYRTLDSRIRGAGSDPTPASPPVFSLRQIQRQLLDPTTRLLRIALGDRQSYAWFVAPGSITAVTLPPRTEIDRLSAKIVELMRTARTPTSAQQLRAEMQRDAGALSEMLLGQIKADLREHRLLLICDGLLQLVPFAALPEPGRETALIVQHEIAMLPSASAAIELKQRAGRTAAPGLIAVVADAVYEEDDPRLTPLRPLPTDSPDGDLAADEFRGGRLMLARTEADSILKYAKSAPSFTAFDFAANRDAMQRLGGYRIVHLAAHAVSDSVRPELSAVILSQYDAEGRRRRGRVRLHEITTDVTLQADVVVLSACSSVDGPDLPGEGVMGLARGFLAAGAASVIGSLNNVHEEPTVELMKKMYGELLGPRRLRPAAALREAQLSMMRNRRFNDPFYWSAFVFVGDPR